MDVPQQEVAPVQHSQQSAARSQTSLLVRLIGQGDLSAACHTLQGMAASGALRCCCRVQSSQYPSLVMQHEEMPCRMIPNGLGALCSKACSPSATRRLQLLHARLALGILGHQQQGARLSVACRGVLHTFQFRIWCHHAGHPKLTRSLNFWLHAAADRGNIEAAAAGFEDLQARGAAPNLASFNALFRVSASLGNDLTC